MRGENRLNETALVWRVPQPGTRQAFWDTVWSRRLCGVLGGLVDPGALGHTSNGPRSSSFAGRVAVVTGASKGIWLATTRTLLEEGARVVASSRKTTPELNALAGRQLVHVPTDLMDPAAPALVISRAVDAFGGLDILVNNAGGPPPGVKLPRFSFLAPTDADWQAMFEFNLFSTVRAVRAAIPPMLERGGGAIVNVSTGNARQPAPMNVDYSAAKAGMNNLTKALSEEYGPQGIRVNTVSPGPVRTAWWTEEGGAADIIAAQAGTDRDTVMDTVAPEMMKLTTGRLVDPQEVADMIALLVSPRSASTTGSDFVVDSGFLKELQQIRANSPLIPKQPQRSRLVLPHLVR